MAIRTPLQEQLLKAGLAKKHKVAEAARELARQRQGKTAAPADAIDSQRLQAERAERDRALAAERNAQAKQRERRAQIGQIIDSQQVAAAGDITYRFIDQGQMQSLQVDALQRNLLAKGQLIVVRHGDGYALLPRAVLSRIDDQPDVIVLDHGQTAAATAGNQDDDWYAQFVVPDDLSW